MLLEHLPPAKKVEMQKILDCIMQPKKAQMVILFGSFARGDWVSDRYRDGQATFEYQSDYDVLVVTSGERTAKNYGVWNEVEKNIATDPDIHTPVSLIVDGINFVNKKIQEGNYFYVDIKREGIVLYDSGKCVLAKEGTLDPAEKKKLIERDYKFWFKKSQSFLKDYAHNITDGELNNAAFHLHQAAESLYTAILLVYTGYKPKTHNLEKIEKLVLDRVASFPADLFPKQTEEGRRLFNLLRKAYVDARYSADYVIKEEELDYLYQHISSLQTAVKIHCEQYLKSL